MWRSTPSGRPEALQSDATALGREAWQGVGLCSHVVWPQDSGPFQQGGQMPRVRGEEV